MAAYRDPELGPTIDDCIAQARFPERLRIGVCWQHGADDAPPAGFADPRVQVLDAPWGDSRGACWARAQVMTLWAGEDWYLQLDSHHRFAKDWDVLLLDQAARSGSPKPIITTYAPPYSPGDAVDRGSEPYRMELHSFSDDGIPGFHAGHFADWSTRRRPIRGRYLSAHFLFAPGRFVRDVPYDPELYFTGEEITLAVRAFTHGYDLFEPTRIILWHEYSREGRRKHWDDHLGGNGWGPAWHQRDAASRAKVRRLLVSPWVGSDGCGTERSVREYEAFAGLNFRLRRIQDYTRFNLEPPNPQAEDGWADVTRKRRVHIMVNTEVLPAAAIDEPQFWYVGFHTAEGVELYRQDADAQELTRILADRPTSITLTRTFESTAEPATWTVIPYARVGGWLQSISGPVSTEHAALIERID